MSELNDKNTQTVVRQAHDRVSTILAHFYEPDATWDGLSQSNAEQWLEMAKVDLIMLGQCIEHRLQEIHAVEPVEYGT